MHCVVVFFSLYHTCVINALTKVHVQKTNWNYHGVITVQADKNGVGRPVLPVHRVFVLLPFCCWAYHRTFLFSVTVFFIPKVSIWFLLISPMVCWGIWFFSSVSSMSIIAHWIMAALKSLSGNLMSVSTLCWHVLIVFYSFSLRLCGSS